MTDSSNRPKGLIRSSSAWTPAEIGRFLARQRIPIRLACATDGGPLVCSLWYVFTEGVLWCATQNSARIIHYLEREPQCGFEIAPECPPYRGVRGQGLAEISQPRGGEVLLELIDRYLENRDTEFARWLMQRADREVAIRIEPRWLTSWDFSGRMPKP